MLWAIWSLIYTNDMVMCTRTHVWLAICRLSVGSGSVVRCMRMGIRTCTYTHPTDSIYQEGWYVLQQLRGGAAEAEGMLQRMDGKGERYDTGDSKGVAPIAESHIYAK